MTDKIPNLTVLVSRLPYSITIKYKNGQEVVIPPYSRTTHKSSELVDLPQGLIKVITEGN